jgi:hypothetical protein
MKQMVRSKTQSALNCLESVLMHPFVDEKMLMIFYLPLNDFEEDH